MRWYTVQKAFALHVCNVYTKLDASTAAREMRKPEKGSEDNNSVCVYSTTQVLPGGSQRAGKVAHPRPQPDADIDIKF